MAFRAAFAASTAADIAASAASCESISAAVQGLPSELVHAFCAAFEA
jgi:hypothetical protein